jgi:predicted permease
MDARTWREIVRRHAAATGARDLPAHAVDELAAHLEDLYQGARDAGTPHAAAFARALDALTAAPLASLGGPRRRSVDPVPLGVPGLARTPSLRSLTMMQSLRVALRQFTQHRTFALVTVLVLGLGIGSSVAVYSIVDGVLLEPLPFREPDRLITWWDTNVERGLSHEPLSPVNFMDARELDVFEDAAGWWRPDITLSEPGADPARIPAIETGANLFSLLGVRPQLGPGFPDDGPVYSRDLIAVVSDRFWRSKYGGDPGLVGRTIQLNGQPYTVVGVMPPGFHFPDDVDIWQRSSWDFTQHIRAAHFMEAVARLAPGVTFEQADAALTGLSARLAAEFPATNKGWSVRPVALLDDQLGYFRPALMVLFGAVGLLMAIAALNVASLLLTRALSREREMAVRTALGAAPRQLTFQLLAEAAVLSSAGAIAGTIAAATALPLIKTLTPVEVPRLANATLDVGVLAFAVALAVATTLFFGLVPALAVLRRSVSSGLRSGDRGASRATGWLYRGLVSAEVALAVTLLVGSGLLVRTVANLAAVPTGVTNGDAIISNLQVAGRVYPDWPGVSTAWSRILDRLREQPGIRQAGATNFLPFEAGWRIPFSIEGEPAPPPAEAPLVQIVSVTDGYFEAIGARLASGRHFTSRDDPTAPAVAIVNETFAARHLAGRQPAGAALVMGVGGIGPLGRNLLARVEDGQVQPGRFEVVGVVADVRNVPIGQPVEPAVYLPARQFPFRSMLVTIDAANGAAAVTALRETLREIAPTLPFTGVTTWAERVRARSAEPRVLMALLVFFGSLAGLLAALGVYGLFAWLVALRRRDLAIRLTLGARPAGIGLSVLRQSAALVAVGLAAGAAVVLASGRALSRVLFDVSPVDAGSLVVAGAVLFAATILACLPAALRAMRVDPIEGLRIE